MHRNVKVLICYLVIFALMCIFMANNDTSNYTVFHGTSSCQPGRPCVYSDEVNLRVIVLTYNRSKSLLKLLASLEDLELDGDRAVMEIWIDRDKRAGQVDNATLTVVTSFKWSRGPTRVHVQKKHVGIYGQWIDTWRSPLNNDLGESVGLVVSDTLRSPCGRRPMRNTPRSTLWSK